MKIRYALALSVAILLQGCASSAMIPQPQAPELAQGNARVVFMRSSFVGSAISASLYEVKDNETVLVGIIDNASKLAFDVVPGHHTFMVVSEAADFMEADLSADKTYYSLITPRMGAWKARFSLWPIRTDGSGDFNTSSSDFSKWQSGTTWVSKTPAADNWYRDNAADIKAKQAKYLVEWKDKAPSELQRRTLRPQDGM